MKSFEISVPSKTFLLGEYAVLQGQGALLLATEPRFKLAVSGRAKNTFQVEGIHPESPAGKMLAQDTFYKQFHFQFIDPYHGLGGFGASSAQFVMLYALKKHLESEPINMSDMLKVYEKFSWDSSGLPPSGLDLITQLQGQICYYAKNKDTLKSFAWPSPDLGYCLIHTGRKLATHDHLKEPPNFDAEALSAIVQSGLASLESDNSQGFIEAINQYRQALQSQHLIAEHTQVILKQLGECADILAYKGCGALGADVIIVIYNIAVQNAVLAVMKKLKLNVIAHGNHVATGIEIREIN